MPCKSHVTAAVAGSKVSCQNGSDEPRYLKCLPRGGVNQSRVTEMLPPKRCHRNATETCHRNVATVLRSGFAVSALSALLAYCSVTYEGLKVPAFDLQQNSWNCPARLARGQTARSPLGDVDASR